MKTISLKDPYLLFCIPSDKYSNPLFLALNHVPKYKFFLSVDSSLN